MKIIKKRFLLLGLLTCTLGLAQEEKTDNGDYLENKKHELRLDVTEAIIVPALEINYEYVISKYSGAGAAININLSWEDEFDGQNFAFTPYYRQYFFNKKDYGARGFFLEGNLQAAGGDDYNYFFDGINGQETKETWFNVGAGAIIGQKWVSNNGFVFEISAGGGRYFINNEFGPMGYFRGGILAGYRF